MQADKKSTTKCPVKCLECTLYYGVLTVENHVQLLVTLQKLLNSYDKHTSTIFLRFLQSHLYYIHQRCLKCLRYVSCYDGVFRFVNLFPYRFITKKVFLKQASIFALYALNIQQTSRSIALRTGYGPHAVDWASKILQVISMSKFSRTSPET